MLKLTREEVVDLGVFMGDFYKVSKKPGTLIEISIEKRKYFVLAKISQKNKNLYMKYSCLNEYKQDPYGFFPWNNVEIGSRIWNSAYRKLQKIYPDLSEYINGFR